jgi:acyl-CoA thioester hydrolase
MAQELRGDAMDELARPPEMKGHPVIISWPVQWGDQDAFGHVNNVVYFRWFESARIQYFRQAGLDQFKIKQNIGPILASMKGDFRRQLVYPDTLLISASIRGFGRTSMKMAHLIYSTAQQAIAAEGDSVIVIFDYANQRPTPVPDSIRATIEGLEGRTGQ